MMMILSSPSQSHQSPKSPEIRAERDMKTKVCCGVQERLASRKSRGRKLEDLKRPRKKKRWCFCSISFPFSGQLAPMRRLISLEGSMVGSMVLSCAHLFPSHVCPHLCCIIELHLCHLYSVRDIEISTKSQPIVFSNSLKRQSLFCIFTKTSQSWENSLYNQ